MFADNRHLGEYFVIIRLMYLEMRHTILVLFTIFLSSIVLGQGIAIEGSESEVAFKKQYEQNIRLTKLNGVYIPGSVREAHKRLSKLTPADAISKFASAPEKEVCKKLHFGIGRWMIGNWNFFEGSRLSHLLKQKGVLHPDDMAQFLLRTYHRHLNDLPLDEERLAEELAEERKKVADEVTGKAPF